MSDSDNKTMRLSELLLGITHTTIEEDVIVSGVSEYSADVEGGDLFVAVSGFKFCQQAIDNGAAAIIYQHDADTDEICIDAAVPVIKCENLSSNVSNIVLRFYGDAAKNIKTVAITGTDGKSSVAHMVAQALEASGDACGLIGTLGYGQLNSLSEATHTTPPSARLAKEYTRLYRKGCDMVALEASSHGIHQQRLRGLSIHTAVLTNITRDHLDYHKTLEDYIQAKAALFFGHHAKYAVINLDDEIGRQWCQALSASLTVVSYSLKNTDADVSVLRVEYSSSSTNLCLNIHGRSVEVKTVLLGEFNVLNLLAVAAVLLSLGKSIEDITVALNKLDAVPGRMQLVDVNAKAKVIVDYAHTPAALFAAIAAMRKHQSGKLICVFGCGGDRDKGKRPQMGEVASKNSDYVVITSDNPRGESAEKIMQEISQGCVSADSYICISDRKEAITHAINFAEDGDSVLIAGKGHEKYQYIGENVVVFDDVEVARQALKQVAHG